MMSVQSGAQVRGALERLTNVDKVHGPEQECGLIECSAFGPAPGAGADEAEDDADEAEAEGAEAASKKRKRETDETLQDMMEESEEEEEEEEEQ
jgi:hypothetical protein